jgi:hypothetical protein
LKAGITSEICKRQFFEKPIINRKKSAGILEKGSKAALGYLIGVQFWRPKGLMNNYPI